MRIKVFVVGALLAMTALFSTVVSTAQAAGPPRCFNIVPQSDQVIDGDNCLGHDGHGPRILIVRPDGTVMTPNLNR